MANPCRLTIQLAAAVANGFCLSQTPAAAGALTLNGSLVTAGVGTPDVPRRVSIASAGADTARVFTLIGTNRDGNRQTETITGVANGTPGQSVYDYKTLVSVSVDAATAAAITVGTNGVGSTAWVPTSVYQNEWALSAAVVVLSGAVNYTVEYTYDDVNASLNPTSYGFILEANSAVPPVPWSHPTLRALTSTADGSYPGQPIVAHRLTINSGTGQAAFYSVQAGLIS